MATSLLRTKLFVPPVRREWVSRPRLIERMNAGLDRELTLVCAPAGFGKTTLVSEWVASHRRGGSRLERRGIPPAGARTAPLQFAWLSLDEGDNDPARFLTYLIAALQTVDADIGKEVLSALQAPQPSPFTSVLTSLINELALFPGRIVLVLDDYHLIDDARPASAPIHDALAFLLDHLPPSLHLVIATREDPSLPLARLRARGQLTELRGTDLRFTPPEAAEFLNTVMGLNLSAQDIAALETRTEGWIAGLQLAALSLQGQSDVSGRIRSFTGSHRFVLDYLLEEVLHQQPASVQAFLFQTSILDRLCGPLCEAVCPEETDGQTTLEYLERANLLVVPLDDERQWYRYHHLFADVLQARLIKQQPDQVALLHRRASEWYERQDMLADAIRHALVAHDYARAARLTEIAWPAWSGPVPSITWLGWAKALPDEVVRAMPVLSAAYAQALLSAGELEAAEARLLDAERWLEPTGDWPEDPATTMVVADEAQFRALPVWLATTRAYYAQAIGDLPEVVRYTRQVLDLLPQGDHAMRGSVTMLLGLAHWASGDLVTAHRTFSDGTASRRQAGNIPGTIDAGFVLADMEMVLGHLYEAVRTCERALQIAQELGEPMPQGTEDVYTQLGKLHREQGDLDAAAQALAAGKTLGEQVEIPDWQYRWCIAQAELQESLGNLDDALDLLDDAARLYVRTPLPNVRPIAALKVRVWVRQGKLAEAQSWVRERGLSVDDDLAYLDEFEHVTLARVLIAQYRSDRVEGSVREAMALLERLLEAAEKGSRTGSALEILVLQALAFEAQDAILPALASLERALTLAEPEGYFRLFVDEGPPMARLLSKAANQGIRPDYAAKLLAAFPDSKATPVGQPESPESGILKSELLEPLSERELEVLRLMAEGLTNPEIASRLFLSLNTIKVHARNIYGKLGVHNRTQAVVRARNLGILPSTQKV